MTIEDIDSYQSTTSINKKYYEDIKNLPPLFNNAVVQQVSIQYLKDHPNELFQQRPARIVKNQSQFATTVFHQLHPGVREKL